MYYITIMKQKYKRMTYEYTHVFSNILKDCLVHSVRYHNFLRVKHKFFNTVFTGSYNNDPNSFHLLSPLHMTTPLHQ